MGHMKNEQEISSSFDFLSKRNRIQDFFSFDIRKFERLLREKDEVFWQKKGEERALKLFHAAAKRVPAYKDFLKKHGINPDKIKTIRDFTQVPVTDKQNYIQQYPLAQRSWDGDLREQKIAAVSSGTTGEPTFWPRGSFQEFEQGIIHELLYRFLFDIEKHRTLLVIGFPMGIYVSGVATALPSFLVATKGYPLTIASVGNSKNDILRTIKHLQKDYEQIILAGHPFFIKDVVETGRTAGVVWSQKKMRVMFCSEEFSEHWRRYVAKRAGIKPDLKSLVNVYGSSDMLLIGYETPISIFSRALAETNESFRSQIFGDETPIAPQLFQYNPLLRYIESENRELLFTSASGIPLIRFNIHDAGNIISYQDVTNALCEVSPAWKRKLHNQSRGAPLWPLPFIALHGRSDQTVIFYAANIYPDHIRIALDHDPFFNKITGKFTMHKRYTKHMDASLELHIELRNNIKPNAALAERIRTHVVNRLKEISIEYADASARLDKDLRPRVKLWPYQHPKYFKPGAKPRYIAQK